MLDNQELRELARPGEPSIRLEAKGMFGGQIEQPQPSFCCGIVRLGMVNLFTHARERQSRRGENGEKIELVRAGGGGGGIDFLHPRGR